MTPGIREWVIDVYAASSVLLGLACVVLLGVRQPARRLAVGRSTLVGTLALVVLMALPGWPRLSWRTGSRDAPPRPAPSVPESVMIPSVTDRAEGKPARRTPSPRASGVLPPPARLESPGLRLDRAEVAWWAWGLGVGLGGAWVAVGGIAAASATRRMRAAPPACLALLARVVGQGRRMPRLCVSPEIGQPAALGALRPTIVLPESAALAESERSLEAILIHEWAHIKNGDLWLLALARVLLPLLFFHPAYWWLRHRIRGDQELLADAEASRGDDPVAYAEILLHWAQAASSRPPRRLAGAAALWERPSQLRSRITMLLDRNQRVEGHCPRAWRLGVPGLTVLGVLALSLPTLRPLPAAGADAPPPARPAEAGTTVSLHGRVLGPNGKPLAGATVGAIGAIPKRKPSPGVLGRVETDAGGRFRLDLPAGDFQAIVEAGPWASVTVEATSPGLGPDWVQVRALQKDDLELRLVSDEIPILGRVLDLEGKPVVGAKVSRSVIHAEAGGNLDPYLTLVRDDPFRASNHNFAKSFWAGLPLPGQADSVLTDADGRFRISGIGRDRLVDLAIEGTAIQSASVTVMTRDSAPVSSPPGSFARKTIHGARFEYVVPPGRALTGRVRDKVTRNPIAGVWVAGNGTTARTTTDAEGRYTLTGFAKGKSYALMVGAGDRAPYFVTCLRVPDTAGLAPITADVDCVPGIPMRLTLLDAESRAPVKGADVYYEPVHPNPHVAEVPGYNPVNGTGPYNSATQEADGTYVLGVLPGPGAVFVRTAEGRYRPACVDPKAFFKKAAGGKTEGMIYGDRNTIYIAAGPGVGGTPQDQFSAIVLVDPPEGAGPQAVEEVMVPDRKLEVRAIGPDGQPLSGVSADGAAPGESPGTLRIARLNPLRPRRVTFTHAEKRLAGFLLAKGNERLPCTVTLRPWGTIMGRLVDARGNPRAGVDLMTSNWEAILNDPAFGILGGLRTDREGRFRADRLVPGQEYSASAVGQKAMEGGYGVVIDRVTLKPGEVRDLGDVRSRETPRELRP